MIIVAIVLVIGSFATIRINRVDEKFIPGEIIVEFNKDVIFRDGDDFDKNAWIFEELRDIYGPITVKPVFSCVKSNERILEENPSLSARCSGKGEPLDLSCVYLIRFLDEGKDIRKIIRGLQTNYNVIYAEPNYIFYYNALIISNSDIIKTGTFSYCTNDPYFPQQDSLRRIMVPDAWTINKGEGFVKIAVIDSGVDYLHEDLKDNIFINLGEDTNFNGKIDNYDENGIDDDKNDYDDDFRGWNFGDNTNDVTDYFHGTCTAGVAAAVTDNGKGIAGVSWKSKILPIKISESKTKNFTTLNNISSAIEYAVDNGADIINYNWAFGGVIPNTLESAILYAYCNGAIQVCGAGNHGKDASLYNPGNSPYVINVSGFSSNSIWPNSNYGIKIDVAAPAEDILLCVPKDISSTKYIKGSGTSAAAPCVAGVIALILSEFGEYAAITNEQIRQIIRSTADDYPNTNWHSDYGYGVINAYRALVEVNNLKNTLAYSVNNIIFGKGFTPCEAKILSPKVNYVSGNTARINVSGIVEIEGVANGFKPVYLKKSGEKGRYELFYAKSLSINNKLKDLPSSAWKSIFNSNTPVPLSWKIKFISFYGKKISHGLLGKWDTTSFTPGPYIIKLVVTDDNGKQFEDRIEVYVTK